VSTQAGPGSRYAARAEFGAEPRAADRHLVGPYPLRTPHGRVPVGRAVNRRAPAGPARNIPGPRGPGRAGYLRRSARGPARAGFRVAEPRVARAGGPPPARASPRPGPGSSPRCPADAAAGHHERALGEPQRGRNLSAWPGPSRRPDGPPCRCLGGAAPPRWCQHRRDRRGFRRPNRRTGIDGSAGGRPRRY